METKTYGKFGDNFDYYTVEETGYFNGECVCGNELLRTADVQEALTEVVRVALGDRNDLPDVREEYDWGICYTFSTRHGQTTIVSITGRTE